MNFGTLDIIKQKDGNDYYKIDADREIEIIIQRIIPSCERFPLMVRVHPENTRLIRMVTKEFPLEIKTSRWLECQDEITKVDLVAEKLRNLNYIELDGMYFNGKLMPFQKQGLDFLIKTNGNTLVTDEMGLGKTIESLAFISTRPEAMPTVVVTPLVTVINWEREIKKFLSLTSTKIGNQTLLTNEEKRTPVVFAIRSGNTDGKLVLPPADFYLINYELVGKRIKDLIAVNPKTVIWNEIHSLRNDDTEKYKACMMLSKHDSVRHRIGLSGTPIYNHGTEMFSIVEILKSGLLGERDEFIRKYCTNYHHKETTEDGRSGLANLLKRTIMIRRKKIDVLHDLPEKIRMKQSIEIDVDLYESEIDKLYNKINLAREQLSTVSGEDDKKEGLFELNKQIRELTIAERQIAGLAKAPYVVEYMKNLLEGTEDEKFVVFCHHINVHRAICDGLFQYRPVQIIGGQKDIERQMAIDSFQNNRYCRVIVCGLRAGSLGINLTSSAYVIFAELDWSPSVHRQAEDRLHRIGQKSNVFAHYLEGIGTFDEILAMKLLEKTVEISDALGDKLESLDNKKAVEFLESKFKMRNTSRLAELIPRE